LALPPAQRRGANAAHGLYAALTPETHVGYDMRTFECLECKRQELQVVKRA
jgi:hypothetical protein